MKNVHIPSVINHILIVFALNFSTDLAARTVSGEATSGDFRLTVLEQNPDGRLTAFKMGALKLKLTHKSEIANCELSETNFWMPEHRHGMNTIPKWRPELNKGEWLIEGVKLHMAGLWEIIVKVRCDAKDITFRVKIKV